MGNVLMTVKMIKSVNLTIIKKFNVFFLIFKNKENFAWMNQIIIIQIMKKINASLIKIHKHVLNAKITEFKL